MVNCKICGKEMEIEIKESKQLFLFQETSEKVLYRLVCCENGISSLIKDNIEECYNLLFKPIRNDK